MDDNVKSKGQLITELQAAQERIASLEAELAALQEQHTGDLSPQGRESEIEMTAIFAAMSDVILVLDAEGRYLKVAPTNPGLLYKPPEELVGKTLHELFPQNVADRFFGYIQQALETGEPVHFDYPLPIADQTLWFDATLTRMHDNAVVWVARNVTASRLAAQQLQLQTLMLEVAANGIAITDSRGHIIWVNRAFSELTGYEREELLGKTPRVLKSGVHDAAFYTEMWRTILAGNVWQGDLVNRRKDGSLYYEEMTITPVKDENDDISHFIAIKQDVTERQAAAQALEAAYEDLEKQVAARTAELVTANAQLEKRVQDLAVINEGGKTISAALDLDELLRALHEQVRRIVETDNFYVALYDQDEDIWQIPYWFDHGVQQPPVRYEVGEGLTGHIIRTQKPLFFRSPEEIIAFNEERGLERIGDQAQSWMGVPLLARDEIVGVMGVQDYEHPNSYTEADLYVFSTLATQAAISLENARLFQNINMARDAEQQRSEQLRQLNALTARLSNAQAALSRAVDEAQILEALVMGLGFTEGARLTLTYFDVDAQGIPVTVRTVAAWHNGKIDLDYPGLNMTVALDKFPLAGLVLRDSTGMHFIPDVTQDTELEPAAVQLLSQWQVKSVLVVPLHRAGRWYGSLLVNWLDIYTLDADTEFVLSRLLESLISVVALRRTYLAQQRANLESARRAVQLSTAAEVSRSASSILDLDILLPQVVQLIQERFDLYYAGIFLVDQSGTRATLRAGTGEAGRTMLARNHGFELGSASMIAACIEDGKPRIALDVGEEAVRFNNPLLPETHSEMALPLISRDQVIGAMTFQDSRPEAFSAEDITALQTMADQLANTIANAQLFAQTQASLAETEALYNAVRNLSAAQSLDEMLANVMHQISTVDINQATLLLVEPDPESDTECLVAHANWHSDLGLDPIPLGTRLTTDVFNFGGEQDAHEPIFVDDIELNKQLGGDVKNLLLQRGIMAIAFFPLWAASQQLGMLMLAVRQSHWFSEREVQFYTALAGQMAVAIERQQLFVATERRARRERLLREITESVRGSMDPETIMRTAVRELGHALGRPAFAQLGDKENLLQAVSLPGNGQMGEDEIVPGGEHNE